MPLATFRFPRPSGLTWALLLNGLTLSGLISCQKQPEPAQPSAPQLYPKTIHFLTTPGARAGRDITHTFDYNSQNKVTRLLETNRDSFGQVRTTKIVLFQYDASGKLVTIKTYGEPYFAKNDNQSFDTTAPAFNIRLTYLANRVKLVRPDSVEYKGVIDEAYRRLIYNAYTSYVDFTATKAVAQFNVTRLGYSLTYTYDLTANGQVKGISFEQVYPGANQTGAVRVDALYDAVYSPFVNTPELRLYSLLREEEVYNRQELDMLLQTTHCLKAATLTYNTPTPVSPTTVTYAYVVNEQGYPLEVKSDADNNNGFYWGKAQRCQYTLTYERR